LPLIEFKYSYFKDKKIPLIPLEVEGKDGWLEIWAFVDSGASLSVFDKDEALNLGLDFKNGQELMVVVGDGSYIPIYIHKLQLKIGEEIVKAEVGFSERLGVGFNLLGRKDVFEKFKVCFSDQKGVVSFEREAD
jgi:hypothetical protein